MAEECAAPECDNNRPEDKDYFCEDCEPTEEEIRRAEEWGKQFAERWQKATEKLDQEIEECGDCGDEMCERHRARANLAFSGSAEAEEVEKDLQSLEMRLDEEVGE